MPPRTPRRLRRRRRACPFARPSNRLSARSVRWAIRAGRLQVGSESQVGKGLSGMCALRILVCRRPRSSGLRLRLKPRPRLLRMLKRKAAPEYRVRVRASRFPHLRRRRSLSALPDPHVRALWRSLRHLRRSERATTLLLRCSGPCGRALSVSPRPTCALLLARQRNPPTCRCPILEGLPLPCVPLALRRSRRAAAMFASRLRVG